MHAQFECLLNGGSLQVETPEVALLAKFSESQRNALAFRTEWKVYADEEDVAGSVDYVAMQADGAKVIVDWKREIWKINAISSAVACDARWMMFPIACSGITACSSTFTAIFCSATIPRLCLRCTL